MPIRFSIFTLAGLLAVSPAFAGSLGHSGQAVLHSARAGSHASVATIEGVATVIAIPLAVGGSAVQITGTALESAGAGSAQAGSNVLKSTARQKNTTRIVRANPAPRLD